MPNIWNLVMLFVSQGPKMASTSASCWHVEECYWFAWRATTWTCQRAARVKNRWLCRIALTIFDCFGRYFCTCSHLPVSEESLWIFEAAYSLSNMHQGSETFVTGPVDVHFSSQHWIHWMIGVCCMTLYTAVIMQMSELMHVARHSKKGDAMGCNGINMQIQTYSDSYFVCFVA